MGASFTNYQARTKDRQKCAKAVASVIRARALVTEAEAGWISVYDEQSESQDHRELERVAKSLSTKLATEVFGFLVHDSDIFMYILYRKGKLVDRFNSRPEYFGPIDAAERKKWSGHFEKLLPLASRNVTLKQIQQTSARKHVFAEELVAEFAKLMGINPDRAQTGFKYLQQECQGFQLVHGARYSRQDADLADAVDKGDTEEVRSLLARGISPNGKNSLGDTFLVDALRCGRTELAAELLRAGADPFQNPHADALWAAASHGHLEIVRLILKNGPRALKERFPAALTNAVLYGHIEIVEELVNAGADPNLSIAKGTTHLMTACCRGIETVVEMVTGRRSADRPGAKPTDWIGMVSVLLKAGADVNARNDLGLTALMMAKGSGQQEIVEMLLKAGADPNIKPGPKFAEMLGKLKVAGLEIRKGNADEGDKRSATPMRLDPRFRKVLLEQLTATPKKNKK